MRLSRRRFLTVAAALYANPKWANATVSTTKWQGRAFGAEVSITLRGDQAAIRPALNAAKDAIRRIESYFSLYDPDSALSRLNRDGSLKMSPEFARLIDQISLIHAETDGLFDPTIQPIFAALMKAKPGAISAASSLVGWNNVVITNPTISLIQPGMSLTFNGIAQGYATDRVTEILKTFGFEDIVVNIGEYRVGTEKAIIGVANENGDIFATAGLRNRAVATSSPGAFVFPNGVSQMIHPTLEAPVLHWETVSVIAENATLADGLSTALCLAEGSKLAMELIDKKLAYTILTKDTNGKVRLFGDRSVF